MWMQTQPTYENKGSSTINREVINYLLVLNFATPKRQKKNTSRLFTRDKLIETNHGLKGAKTTTELCPPNPNEFEIAENACQILEKNHK
jgi:hypothetical protein